MRTIISAVVILAAALLQMIGVEISVADQEGIVNNLVIIIAALMVIYARYNATRNLKTGGLLKPETKADGNET